MTAVVAACAPARAVPQCGGERLRCRRARRTCREQRVPRQTWHSDDIFEQVEPSPADVRQPDALQPLCTQQQQARQEAVESAAQSDEASDDSLVVLGLIVALENISASASAQPPAVTTRFHGKKAPTASLRRYVWRLHEYYGCSEACFVLALAYIDKVLRAHPSYDFGPLSGHRMLLSAVVLAIKFLDDQYLKSSYYAKVGGLSAKELGQLELKMMKLLGFRLFVSPEELDVYRTVLYNAGLAAIAAGGPRL